MSCLPKKSISLPKTWPDRALLQCRSLPARVAPPELPKWPLDPGRRLGLGSWHDFLDLTGLHFHAGATAKYHPATEVLDVHSGHRTDKLTLVSPHGTHFEAASDHHGGTDVFLVFA